MMYSGLFAGAWFGAGDNGSSRLALADDPVNRPLASAPAADTIVRVGNDGDHHFVAHRAVLVAHSGYMKALLSAADLDDPRQTHLVATVTIPSAVGGEAFAALLNYMYSGCLEVTADNVYAVLLATHLLHMPGALEQCRAALVRLRAPDAAAAADNGGVVRPVPGRFLAGLGCFGWPNAAQLYPLELPRLPAHLPLTASLLLPPAPDLPLPTAPTPAGPGKERSPTPPSPPSPRSAGSDGHARVHTRSESTSPELVVASSSASSVATQRGTDERHLQREQQQRRRINRLSERMLAESLHRRRRSDQSASAKEPTKEDGSDGSGSNGVILDVACCDGPVRFHRVLNANYAPADGDDDRATKATIARRCSGRAPAASGAASTSTSAERRQEENDENEENAQEGPSGCYSCDYCRHTFKSQYCYRKHARRHLLLPSPPSSVPSQPTLPSPSGPTGGASPQSRDKKREVRLLDLNVQYYPCKLCGSKFPSYYFVHKHRKLCHADADEAVPVAVAGPPTPTVDEDGTGVATPSAAKPEAKV